MSSTADLDDKRIGVVMGSVYDRFATSTYPQSTVLQFDSQADLLLAVLAGKIDAGLTDEEPLRDVLRTNSDLAILGDPLLTLPLGVGFQKGNPMLRDAFNRFLAEIRKNGVHADMVDRWLTRRDTRMPTLPAPRSNGAIVVGVSAGGLPYAAIQDGVYVGFDIEMVTRFAASLGRDVTFSQMPFGALIAANASGKVDMIAASIFITEERQQRIDFSDPYHETAGRAFALNANIAADPEASADGGTPLLVSIDDLKDKRIGVQLGTVYDLYATDRFPDATIVQYNTYQDMTLAVSAGKVDAGLSDLDTLKEVRRANPDLVLLGKPIFSSPVAAGFAKSRPDLRDSFNAFLATIRQNGVHADMVDRWMTKRITSMPEIPGSSANGTIAIGVSSGGLPFNALQDGEFVGFDVELARRFAAHIGRQPRLVDQEFGGLIAALASGKVDVIIADMFITKERRSRSTSRTRTSNRIRSLSPVRRAPLRSPAPWRPAIARPSPPGSRPAFTATSSPRSGTCCYGTGSKRPRSSRYSRRLSERLLGAVVCYMRMSPLAILRLPARVYIAALRGTPIVVLLMISFYVVFGSVDINPVLVAIIAFGMNFAAYVSEMFRTGIEGIDRGQREAGLSMGFTPVQTFGFIILPQMIQRILPVYKGEFISLVKMTSVVGYIAVQDLTKASDIIRSRTFDAFFPLIMVAVLYFVIAWVLMQALEYLEHRTSPKRAPMAVAR